MDVEKAIRSRRSVRAYKDKDIEEEKIEKVLEAARLAPSANNKQDWKFIIVKDEEKKEKLWKEAARQEFIKEASAIIAGISTDPEYQMSCKIPGGIVDVTIALDHITLKAAEEGLGTCWIGAFDQERAKEILNVPDEWKIVALMPIGWPKRPLEEQQKPRKSLEEILARESL